MVKFTGNQEITFKSPKDLNLVFRVGDATNLSGIYEDGQFHVAVDKGTLDAIAVNVEAETIANCNAYFNEMVRVLDKKKGHFVIVSLLQPHVLKILLDFFVRENETNKYAAENLFTV